MKENTKASGHSSNNDTHVQNVLPKYKSFSKNQRLAQIGGSLL